MASSAIAVHGGPRSRGPNRQQRRHALVHPIRCCPAPLPGPPSPTSRKVGADSSHSPKSRRKVNVRREHAPIHRRRSLIWINVVSVSNAAAHAVLQDRIVSRFRNDWPVAGGGMTAEAATVRKPAIPNGRLTMPNSRPSQNHPSPTIASGRSMAASKTPPEFCRMPGMGAEQSSAFRNEYHVR